MLSKNMGSFLAQFAAFDASSAIFAFSLSETKRLRISAPDAFRHRLKHLAVFHINNIFVPLSRRTVYLAISLDLTFFMMTLLLERYGYMRPF